MFSSYWKGLTMIEVATAESSSHCLKDIWITKSWELVKGQCGTEIQYIWRQGTSDWSWYQWGTWTDWPCKCWKNHKIDLIFYEVTAGQSKEELLGYAHRNREQCQEAAGNESKEDVPSFSSSFAISSMCALWAESNKEPANKAEIFPES